MVKTKKTNDNKIDQNPLISKNWPKGLRILKYAGRAPICFNSAAALVLFSMKGLKSIEIHYESATPQIFEATGQIIAYIIMMAIIWSFSGLYMKLLRTLATNEKFSDKKKFVYGLIASPTLWVIQTPIFYYLYHLTDKW